ncbi:MAG: tyrosine-type recombinase/integrase [Bacteroidetes bacterium]|nr:tyrosine-type recombinase/integrase [Bacteroidota bacterium]
MDTDLKVLTYNLKTGEISYMPLDEKSEPMIIHSQVEELKLSDIRKRLYSYYQINNSRNTFLSYKSTYENFIRLIGNKSVYNITRADFEEFKVKRRKEVNAVSCNIDIRNIKAIFNKIVEFEILKHSNASFLKQFKIERKKVLAIDSKDILNIIDKADDPQLKQIIKFTLLTASRISEVLNVRIKDLDFDKRIINIYQQKTNCFKTIPITDTIAVLLNEILNSENKSNIYTLVDPESYLFHKKLKNNSSIKLRSDTVSKQFKKILRKLKLSEDFKFHSLRHTSITELLKNNVPVNVVKEIAGHKSITTTMNYSHVNSDDLRKAVNSLNY